MKMTTKGRYAVTAMLDLAIHNSQGSVSLADIAKRQNISQTYLEQLFNKLKHHGLVKSTRGPGGGYQLAIEPEIITVARIIYSVDESINITRCNGKQDCQDSLRCLTHDLWMEFNLNISQFLNNITLGNLLKRDTVKQVALRQDSLLLKLQTQ